jgi:trk system potassium uptake protein TrkA
MPSWEEACDAMKIVILGCGRVGAALANIMLHEGHEVTVIDLISDAFERLGSETKARIRTVIGDGIDEDVLRNAGLETADAFAAVTNGDNRNIMATQIAKHVFHVPRAICRIYDPIRQETYKGLDLESISPTIVGAKLLHDAIVKDGDASAPRPPSPGATPRSATTPGREGGRPAGAGASKQG